MERKEKIREFIRQVGYIRLFLLLLCVVFLIIVSIPEKEEKRGMDVQYKNNNMVDDVTLNENDRYVEKMEERLGEILSLIEGVGEVDVMITLAASTEVIINKDESFEESSETNNGDEKKENKSQTRKEETVLIDEDGDQTPYVIKTVEPVIEGVMVVMEGGDNSTLVSAVIESVEALFHVEPHKIKVLKMEDGS